jgi:hypothetical protein
MLKYTITRTVDLQDWNDLVQKTYGRPYNLQQQDGCMSRGAESITVPSEEAYDFENDSIPEKVNGKEMGVSFKAWLERNPDQVVMEGGYDGTRLFWLRNFYPNLDVLANDLYKRGLIEAGDYVIEIDW